MLSLGPYKFSPTSLRCYKEQRWHTVECIGQISLQNIGSGIEHIDLEGVICPQLHFNDLVDMRESQVKQIPHILAQASGFIFGHFVITHIEEKQRFFLPSGLPRKIEFNLSLKRYVLLYSGE
ncbi:phage tail protein [Candidatus Mesenet endosymbiont of Phosphuga atrata]|uniref:phage tail protein n=1 Tax=Candidatus Mesenet endosymbiont of Phosphuga atrata TaxID=3066221 RepID=UPI0030D493DA